MQVKDSHKKKRSALVIGAICLVLQLALSPYICLGNGFANFALVYAGVIALSTGGKGAVISGFVAGLLYDLTSTTPIGLMALLLTVFGYVLGIEERNRFGDGFVSSLTSFGVGAMTVEVAYHLAMLLLGVAQSLSDVILLRVLPSFALTFIAFLPFAYFLVRAAGSGRGMAKGSSSHHGSRYDVSNL